MSTPTTTTDVLIVGAGPVGLFLASQSARRSLRWRIVEQRAGQSEHSKALAIMPRTLEIFDMAGIVAPFLEAANRVHSVAVVAHGRPLAEIEFAAESPYPFVAMVPQDVTETLLLRALRQNGGAVDYETSFVSAVQDDHGVDAVLERHGERFSVRASFVVGCDGAHSAVRHRLGLPFEGAEYHTTFMLADAETNDALRGDELHLCPHEDGPLALFPMSRTRRRIVATVAGAGDGDAPSLGLVRSMLEQRGPHGIEARSLNWSTYFHVHHRQVAHMEVGRMFVAGDAAHIHSPFGGQGMNTGLQDAWNLAWKLDLVVRGRARPELLDSYTAERQPVIRRVVETTDFITKALGTPSRFAQGIRNVLIPVVSRLTPFQHAVVETLSELGVRYHGSPIVDGAGRRYFDDWLRDGRAFGRRFTLLVDADENPSTLVEARALVDEFSDVLELRLGARRGWALVRPDGYLAYESGGDATSSALASVREVLERQVVASKLTAHAFSRPG